MSYPGFVVYVHRKPNGLVSVLTCRTGKFNRNGAFAGANGVDCYAINNSVTVTIDCSLRQAVSLADRNNEVFLHYLLEQSAQCGMTDTSLNKFRFAHEM